MINGCRMLIIILLMIIATITYGYKLQVEHIKMLESNIDMHQYDTKSKLIITNTKHLNY